MPHLHPLSSRANARVEAKYNVVTEYPNLHLHGAAAKGDIGLVQYALTHGQPANSVLDGILPLHAACSGGSELVVKLLLDFGADVNAPRLPRRYTDRKTEGGTIIGSSGSTPLHFAAANGHAAIVRLLLKQGADPTRTDKHGTSPEALATSFGHDEVAAILREWIASHPPSVETAPVATGDGPPSPSRSRRLPIKRSLENLLTRKGHGMTSVSQSTGAQTLSPSNADPFSGFSGTITPASSSSEAFGAIPQGSRRPSLPQIFEVTPPATKKSHRPRSAGQDGEGNGGHHHTLPARRLASKLSSLFKKPHDQPQQPQPPPLGNGYGGASSPNLLEFLASPVEITRTRLRSSIEEARPTNFARTSLERERSGTPTTAPPSRTTFFDTSPPPQHPEDAESLTPLPSLIGRNARSNSQTRYAPDLRQRADSGTTISSGSSYDAHSQLQSVAAHNNWAKFKRDRSASEGAAGVAKRSPLINAGWVRDENGDVVRKELPGVIADDDEDQDKLLASPEPIERTKPLPPVLTTKRPSLSNAAGGGDSTGSAGPGHNRTSSTQSAKNLRFDLPPSSDVDDKQTPTRSPLTTSPEVTLASPVSPPGMPPKKALRSCASAGSLPAAKAGGASGRSSSAGNSCEEAEEAADSVEPLWSTSNRNSVRAASMNSGYTRPLLPSLVSPSTPSSTTSAPFTPGTATTTSSGGRPWVLPDGYNTSQTSLPTPGGASKSYSSLSVLSPIVGTSKTGPKSLDTDSRLRGASVSSSKSTDTTTSSVNATTPNLASDSGSSQVPPSWSTSASTVSVGNTTVTGSVASVARTVKTPSRIATSSAAPRYPYEIEDDDSSSSDKYVGTKASSPPLPVLLRSVNSHAQAHALVQKAEKEILDLADLPPDSGGLTAESLSAQLAAYGQTLALEKRFARGEAQKASWANRRGFDDDSDDDEDAAFWEEEKSKYPRGVGEAFVPPVKRKGSFGTAAAAQTSPTSLHRMGSLELNAATSKAVKSKSAVSRSRTVKARPPVKAHTSPLMPMRTTPSNVGPPVSELKTPRMSSDDTRHLSHLVLHGIEITKTLPTPTDSPQSTAEMAAAQNSGRNVGVDEAVDSPTADTNGTPPTPATAPLTRSKTPDIMVSDYQPVPLTRISTAPSNNEKLPGMGFGHSRTASTGDSSFLMGPIDYTPPRSESRMGKRFGGLKSFVQTLKGKS